MKFCLKILLVSILIIFSGCDKVTENEDRNNKEEVSEILSQMDKMVFDAIPLNMMMMMQNIPQPNYLSLDSVHFPPMDSSFIPDSNYFDDGFDPLGFLFAFNLLHGTVTLTADTLYYNPEPAESFILIFPFTDFTDNSTHDGKMVYTKEENTATKFKALMQLYIDNVSVLNLTSLAEGENLDFMGVVPTITKLNFYGNLINNKNHDVDFNILILKTDIQITITVDDNSPINIKLTADDFLQGPEENEPQMENISIKFENLEIVINEFEAESGDVGDVFLSDEQVADLLIIDNEVYISFDNGEQVELNSLMINLSSFIALQNF